MSMKIALNLFAIKIDKKLNRKNKAFDMARAYMYHFEKYPNDPEQLTYW